MAAYKWVGRNFNVSADVVGKEIERLETDKGYVKPEDLVDVARPESSPIHRLFEWNDSKAAELYRRSQAGVVIRSISVVITNAGKSIPTRAYVDIKPHDSDGWRRQGQFVNVQSAMTNPISRDVVLSNAKHDMEIFRNKYASLEELSGVFDAIDAVLNK